MKSTNSSFGGARGWALLAIAGALSWLQPARAQAGNPAGPEPGVLYLLEVEIEGDGSATWSPDRVLHAPGSVVEIYPRATVGTTFAGWGGDAWGDAVPLRVSMDRNRNIVARFEPRPCRLVLHIDGEGTVLRSPDVATYRFGDTVQLLAVPAPGHRFVAWGPLGDPQIGDGIKNPLTLTLESDLIVLATFEADRFELAVDISGAGKVNRDAGDSALRAGSRVRLTATPEDGRVFLGWRGSIESADNPLEVVMSESMRLTAVFGAASEACAGGAERERVSFGPVGPNPSRGPVRIGFALARSGRVRLSIIDLAGRRMATLVDEEMSAGRHAASWGGRDGDRGAAPGIYIVHLEADGSRLSRKLSIVQ